MLNKQDIINKVAEVDGVETKAAAKRAVDTVIETIIDSVANGDGSAITGFGSFVPVDKAAREGVNPATKEKIKIPAATVPKFKAGKTFKETVKAAKAPKGKKSKKK